MKKRFFLLVLTLMLLSVALFVTVSAAETEALPSTCEHCKKPVTWTPLTEKELSSSTTLSSGHYYLAFEGDSCESAEKILAGNKQICLYLNGKILKGTGRAFTVRLATLNIMGDGTISGRGTQNTTLGGTIFVPEGSTLNLYGGNLTFEETDASTGLHANNGGVVYVAGNFNMYAGSIDGGVATGTGGNVFVAPTGRMLMTGGTVGTGTAKTGKSVYTRGYLTLTGSASMDEIYMNPATDGTGPVLGEMLTLKGTYTGSATLRLTSGNAVDGRDVGTNDGAVLRSAKLSVYNSSLYVIASGGDIKLSSVPDNKSEGYCESCKKTVQWVGLTEKDTAEDYITSGHYYLAFEGDSCEFGTKTIVGYDRVCLDLNGKHFEGKDRAFHVHTGTLNVMDTVGGGLVTGRGTTSTTYGGTIFVRENGTLNIYGGDFSFEDVANDGRDVVYRGGVLYVRGTVNLYAGRIFDGAAKVGGNIYADVYTDEETGVTYIPVLNLYGGTVGGNVACADGSTTTGPCIYNKGIVTLSGNATVTELRQQIVAAGPAAGDMLILKDRYTGTVKLRFSSFTDGMYAGNVDNADYSNANITIHNSSKAKLVPYGSHLLAIGSNSAVILDDSTVAGTYASLSAAVAAYDATMGRIVLLADAADDLQLQKPLYIDLNGHHLTGTLSGNSTLYCMDAQTDDFSVEDGVYGTVKQTEGVAVEAVPAEFAGTSYGYLKVVQDGKLSFHAMDLALKSVSIRPSAAGMYFGCDFAGDELVKQQTAAFGIVLSTAGAPDALNMDTTCLYTRLDGEQFGTAGVNSCLLSGILKTINDDAVNVRNANMSVYSRAYVLLDSGEYLFGQTCQTSFAEILTLVDNALGSCNITQRKGLIELYDTYRSVMEGWELTNIATWDETLATVAATDYTPYLCPWTEDVVAQAKQDGRLHYYFMSGEGMLISETQSQKDKWGDSCLIVFPDGQTMLVDSGPKAYGPVLAQNLLRMGITKLDYLLITHPHSDHVNGAFAIQNVLYENGLLNCITVGQVLHRGGYDPDSTNSTLAQRMCDEFGIPIDILEKGDTLNIGGVRMEVIWPLVGAGDTLVSGGVEVNDMSIVMRFDFGEHSSLFTGDLYTSGEAMVLENTEADVLDVDFMKVPHHGYLTSSSVDFLKAVSPELAVSTGCLKIPTRLRDRYADLGIELLDDGLRGYIHVSTDGTDLTYETTRNDEATDTPETEVDPEVD